jgi:hypothetical protein
MELGVIRYPAIAAGHVEHDGTVRDREDEGSNPSPPINFEFKIADFGPHPWPPGHSRGTAGAQIRGEPRKRLRSLSRWSADLHLADSDLVAAHSCISVDARVRTVRLPARKPNLVESCKAEHPR